MLILKLVACFCRDTLRRHYNLGCHFLEVAVNDVVSYDADLAEKLLKNPAEYLPIVSTAQ